ncbi:elongation factor 1-delta 1-like isoform X2 [Lycium barbarum]|uniref:elongation factor 1-delta 1-like isoform X2 n=1 Tax=Lycium barbarum TaxID=112863 RepID=UPI00293F178A|nr:elongation factor 1-delta 1-like isoform X2 [Lycium barbarum]XP_060190620.1 elongation factor 1-delta 1-like isoform X2 [Lycium barbarum]XP_060190621.1 elongation factor 1-delta 1-like isoform X2 [Lycium barbarum]
MQLDDINLLGKETTETKAAEAMEVGKVKSHPFLWTLSLGMTKSYEETRGGCLQCSDGRAFLFWGACTTYFPIGNGIKKFQIMLTIVDDLKFGWRRASCCWEITLTSQKSGGVP